MSAHSKVLLQFKTLLTLFFLWLGGDRQTDEQTRVFHLECVFGVFFVLFGVCKKEQLTLRLWALLRCSDKYSD